MGIVEVITELLSIDLVIPTIGYVVRCWLLSGRNPVGNLQQHGQI